MSKKAVAGKIVEHQKKKAEKKVKRAVRHTVCILFGSVFLFGTGYLFGMHHQLIKAWVKKEALPEAPENCWWTK